MNTTSASRRATANTAPLAAALAVLADLPAPDPVPAVSMQAAGRLLIIGEAGVALGWAERLAGQREVTVLANGPLPAPEDLPDPLQFTLLAGCANRLHGHLGAFVVDWQEGSLSRQGEFDVVLDLSSQPLLKRVELPPGYAAPGRDALDQALAVIDLLAFDGEFEKPRYVAFHERLCAHSRSRQAGCSNCISVCASEAIVAAGDRVRIDPYLCQGCGTCSTVCPSGAIAYQYPRVADLGLVIKAQLQAYHAAGGGNACLLFHSAQAGNKALAALLRRGRQLPGHVIPVEVWSADAVGLDLMLGSIALGAAQLAVLGAGSHDLAPLQQQAGLAQTILGGLGFAGEHFRILDDSDHSLDALSDWVAGSTVPAAEFRLLADRRTTLEFVIDHLVRHSPSAPDAITLPAGAPFGAIEVSTACTLCMSCAGACPAGALKAAADAPRLSLLERDCLQCGLCRTVCPEQAISLLPRLLLKERRQERILAEAEVFCCTACGKPMGAKPTIDAMLAKLAGHSMFATPQAKARLTLCGDCRVIDLVSNEDSVKAWEMSE